MKRHDNRMHRNQKTKERRKQKRLRRIELYKDDQLYKEARMLECTVEGQSRLDMGTIAQPATQAKKPTSQGWFSYFRSFIY